MQNADTIAKRLSKPPCESPKKSYSAPDQERSGRNGISRLTKTKCLELFSRLNALYRHKAATEFRAKLPDGSPTPEFRLWCQKLAHLTPEQFAQGMRMLERQEADARRAGDETWPPSYAGFIGLATMATKPRSTVTELPTEVMPKEQARAALGGILEGLG